MFFDRHEAGASLAKKLRQYRNRNVVLYALPKGGVPVGYEIAKALNVPLDLLIVQKIGHPISRDYGICAVTEDGDRIEDECGLCGLSDEWLNTEISRKLQEAARQRFIYKNNQPAVSAEDKIAIIVDDGMATGITIRAAVQAIAKEWPEQIVVATPVGPHDVIKELKSSVDAVIVELDDREFLGTVDSYYENYAEVTDLQVVSLLAAANQRFINNNLSHVDRSRNLISA